MELFNMSAKRVPHTYILGYKHFWYFQRWKSD